MIRSIKICNHCGKQYPDKCDGILYYIEIWGKERILCKGEMNEGNTFRIKDGKPYYHYIRGYGEEWDVQLHKLKL